MTTIAAAAAAMVLARCGEGHVAHHTASSHVAAPSVSPAPTQAAPALTAKQERFVDTVQSKFAAVGKGNTASQIAAFETQVCEHLLNGVTTVATAELNAQEGWTNNWQTPPPSPGTITKLVTLAAHDGCQARLVIAERLAVKIARRKRAARREARQDAAAAAARRLAHTVTCIATGSPANVTYRPAGSDLHGYVPMDVSAPLGNPVYYAISAQLQGGGQVTCEILVGGHVISRSTATGSYNIATCEISQDPLYGGWVNTNG
jgi:hypothetical protein